MPLSLSPEEPDSPEAVAAWIGAQTWARDRFAHVYRASEEHRARHGPSCTVYPSGSGPILGTLAPDANQVCNDLQAEAAAEGYTDFACGTDPIADPEPDGPLPIKRRVAQVTVLADKSVMVDIRDLDIDDSAIPPPAGMNPQGEGEDVGESATFHPWWCDSQPCHVTHTRLRELRHFRGHGPNCAWMRLRQEYDEYSPWAAIYNVEQPVVWGSATAPCSDDNMQGSLHLSGLPIKGQTRAEVDWEFGVPTPWGYIVIRSWHVVIVLKYWANYTVETEFYP